MAGFSFALSWTLYWAEHGGQPGFAPREWFGPRASSGGRPGALKGELEQAIVAEVDQIKRDYACRNDSRKLTDAMALKLFMRRQFLRRKKREGLSDHEAECLFVEVDQTAGFRRRLRTYQKRLSHFRRGPPSDQVTRPIDT